MSRVCRLFVVLILGLPAWSVAQRPAADAGADAGAAAGVVAEAADITAGEYAARRAALAARIGDGVVVGLGAPEPVTDDGTFRQFPAFRYLTGLSHPDAAFMMVVRGGRADRALLYVPKGDPRRALYDGFPPDSAATLRGLGLGVRDLALLRPALDSLAAAGVPFYALADFASRDFVRTDSLTRGRRYVELLREAHPGLEVRDGHPHVDALRIGKSAAEMGLLRRAVEITVASLREVMPRIRPGMNEAELQMLIETGFRNGGAEGRGFGSIVGSGPNSTSFHYRHNNREMRAGDVVVMDVGALYRGYTADVTRTVPVSGVFTPEQRAIYQLVRDAQAAGERQARVGASVAEGDRAIRAVLEAGLAKLGLIESPDALLDPPWGGNCEARPARCKQAYLFMPHGPGHGIGLEVHDIGGYSYSPTGRFEAGEVFSIEPGLYIGMHLLEMLPDTPRNRAFIAKVRPVVERYADIGVRIEDDYILTERGLEWISREPREVAEIEARRRPVLGNRN
jgi:Xaa-Pro aminopeptidase